MSIEGRKTALEAKHTELERKIDTLSAHPSTSDLDLVELKKEKLAIKDEISRIERQDAVAS